MHVISTPNYLIVLSNSIASAFSSTTDRTRANQQGFHTQFGPKQSTVIRWASSHNNTFTLAVVAAVDQKWFYHKKYYQMLDDYIHSAPPGANEVLKKPRWHGASKSSNYLNTKTNTACAGGYCIKDLFKRKVPESDPECML